MSNLASVLTVCSALTLPPFEAWGSNEIDPFPELAASYLLSMGGKVIWAHQPERVLPPASLTKLMTALLVAERANEDEVVTVGADAAREMGKRLGLRAGERLLVRDLLAAMMLESVNDACHALATHVAGSEAAFVVLMNQRAAKLGLRRTNFVNACGHDNPRHHSTATDLLLLANATLAYPVIATPAAAVSMPIATLDGNRRFSLENRNELVGRYPGAVGLKTGHTPNAGNCLVALVRRQRGEALLVLLNASNRWWGAEAILDRAFAQLHP